MGFEYFQTIVQFRINTDTKEVEILKRFTTPFKQTKGKVAPKQVQKPKVFKTLVSEEGTEEYV